LPSSICSAASRRIVRELVECSIAFDTINLRAAVDPGSCATASWMSKMTELARARTSWKRRAAILDSRTMMPTAVARTTATMPAAATAMRCRARNRVATCVAPGALPGALRQMALDVHRQRVG
jgi:hypothetical protein